MAILGKSGVRLCMAGSRDLPCTVMVNNKPSFKFHLLSCSSMNPLAREGSESVQHCTCVCLFVNVEIIIILLSINATC